MYTVVYVCLAGFGFSVIEHFSRSVSMLASCCYSTSIVWRVDSLQGLGAMKSVMSSALSYSSSSSASRPFFLNFLQKTRPLRRGLLSSFVIFIWRPTILFRLFSQKYGRDRPLNNVTRHYLKRRGFSSCICSS